MKYIKYIGEDIILPKNHTISHYKGRKCLTKNAIYKLEYDWNGLDINGYYVLYIYDDIDNHTISRGYEIKVSDIETIRESNLKIILNENN